MALRNIHASKYSFFWGLLILSILVYIIPQSKTNKLNFLFQYLFGRITHIGRDFSPNTSPDTTAPDQTVSQDEYNSLWKKYANLQARQAELEKENATLSRIRKQFEFSDSGLLQAKIITAIRSTRQELIINKGAEQQVAAGQLVLSPQKDSVIGIVRETAESIARVGLLTDSSVSIEVRIRRDNAKTDIAAQMFGDGKNGCQIRFIPRQTDIRKGDTVYAAAHPGKLEVPIVIGQVKEVKVDQDKPLLWSVYVEPIESITNLNQVIIVLPLTQ
jgi:rod shape-determining protein MreC